MSETNPSSIRDIKIVAEALHVNENIIKNYIHMQRMRLNSNGQLTDKQYQAVVQHFGEPNFGHISQGQLFTQSTTAKAAPMNRSTHDNSEQRNSENNPHTQSGRKPTPIPAVEDSNETNSLSVASTQHQNKPQDKPTEFNPHVRDNPPAFDPYATQINTTAILSEKYQTGNLIGGKYRVISSFDNTSGEADLYLCECEGVNYMAKVYRHRESIKDEVWQKLQTVNSPYVVKAKERFSSVGQTVEILPYYKRGSLSSARLNAQQIAQVVHCVNEGLKALHDAGIIHKDIKPANLMWADDGENVLIIDFGISSLLDENRTIKVTSTGLTLQYAAPETLRNIFSHYSDYYALGVSVYELFSGTTPYSGMTAEQIEKYYSIQNCPTPDDAPQAITDLILGTTYFDIRNRKDSDNPNCRWSYEKVKKWCAGEKQVVPGQGIGSGFGTLRDYSFQGKKAKSRKELSILLCDGWQEGKEEFLSGKLVRYFDELDNATSDELREIAAKREDSDIQFMRVLHAIDSGTFAFMWKGKYYQDVKEFAHQSLTELIAKNRQMRSYLEEAMLQHVFSQHIQIVYPQRKDIVDNVRQIEDYFSKQEGNRKERDIYCYVLLYRLLGKYSLYVGEQTFDSVQGLTNYLLQLRIQSPIDFEQFCHQLISYGDTLSPQFEAWLIALGKQKTVREWQKNIQIAKE